MYSGIPIHGMKARPVAARWLTPKYMKAPSAPAASATPMTAVTSASIRNGSAM